MCAAVSSGAVRETCQRHVEVDRAAGDRSRWNPSTVLNVMTAVRAPFASEFVIGGVSFEALSATVNTVGCV